MQIRPLKENFNAGEYGARMAARVQFDKYLNAGAIYENVLPLPQGGFTYRPGSRFIHEIADQSVRGWLLPFVFSTTQSYALELGVNRMRFYKNQAQIAADNTTAAAIANGTFASNITSWTDRDTGGSAASSWNAAGYAQLLGDGTEYAWLNQTVTGVTNGDEISVRFEVKGAPGDYILMRVGTTATGGELVSDVAFETGWHVYTFTATATTVYIGFRSKVAKIVGFDNVSIIDDDAIEITTPWLEADLPNISYAQSADVIYFAIGGSTRVYRLERYGHQSWSLEQVLFEDGPYMDQNTTATTMTLGAATGLGVTLTASAVTGINDDAGFRTTDVGRLIRMKVASNNWGWAQIVGWTSTTVVTIDIKATFTATTATAVWRLGEWNDTDGWPSVVGFIQQRLGFAATVEQPQKFWLSKSADIETFADADNTGTVQDDSSINYRFAALQVNTIRWMASRKKPVIGTQGGNWTLRSEGAVLTPTDIAADFEVSGGVARMQPLEIRSRLLFAQAQSRKLVEFADVLQQSGVQGYDSFDLTLLNDRVLKGGVSQIAYAAEPDSVIYATRADGQLPTLTYQPDQSVIGWARQILGGAYQGGHAVVESVCAIPGQDGDGQFLSSEGRHEVWVIVKREINGATKRYVECFEKIFDGDEDLQEDAFYVDSGLTYSVPITITGITRASVGVVTAPSHGLSNGELVRISRVKGMTEVNGKTFMVASVTTHTFQLQDADGVNVNTTAYTAYSAGGEVREKVSTISGLGHLEGQTVKIFADGAIQTDKTVASGSITLDSAASVVHVGLSYTKRWKSLKLAFSADQGSAIGRPKSIADIILVLLEAAEGSVSFATVDADGTNAFTELDLRTVDEISEDAVPFFTGEKSLGISAGYDEDIRLLLQSTAPTPATILAIAPELDTA